MIDKEKKIESLKRELSIAYVSLHEKNKALDAMWWVWCSGGCAYGTSRWKRMQLTEEIVQLAEKNTKRLRAWYDNHKSSLEEEQ